MPFDQLYSEGMLSKFWQLIILVHASDVLKHYISTAIKTHQLTVKKN